MEYVKYVLYYQQPLTRPHWPTKVVYEHARHDFEAQHVDQAVETAWALLGQEPLLCERRIYARRFVGLHTNGKEVQHRGLYGIRR